MHEEISRICNRLKQLSEKGSENEPLRETSAGLQQKRRKPNSKQEMIKANATSLVRVKRFFIGNKINELVRKSTNRVSSFQTQMSSMSSVNVLTLLVTLAAIGFAIFTSISTTSSTATSGTAVNNGAVTFENVYNIASASNDFYVDVTDNGG